VGPQTGDVGALSMDNDARLSSWLPGIDVASSRGGSWVRLHFALLYLAAKPSHMRADVDGLACLLHHPTVHD
jgi:hypothetical protein